VLSANKHLSGVTNYANRLSIISTDLFQVCLGLLLYMCQMAALCRLVTLSLMVTLYLCSMSYRYQSIRSK